jgi:hypothetical protein
VVRVSFKTEPRRGSSSYWSKNPGLAPWAKVCRRYAALIGCASRDILDSNASKPRTIFGFYARSPVHVLSVSNEIFQMTSNLFGSQVGGRKSAFTIRRNCVSVHCFTKAIRV